MSPTLLQAVVRVADARTSDPDLLERFNRNRDERAFEELVRRHGPLVWSVCRHLLPHHADAEDAFQAVFLALVRGAGSIRAGQALAAWLHGVAVRVAAKVKRSAARRRQREHRAAVPEADRSVPDAAWVTLMTAVHEEVQRLPDAERTAFVLCDLEGVRQPDAAARLGWPLGTLSGRLCKARQRLLEQLTRRGIAPGVLAIGGIAGSAGVVPAALVEQVTFFPVASAAGVSPTVAELARGLVEGATMRTKVLAAMLVAGAIGVTGGAMVLSKADAQGPATGEGAPTGGGPGVGPPQGGFPPPGGVPAGPGGLLPGSGTGGLQPPGGFPAGPGPGAGGGLPGGFGPGAGVAFGQDSGLDGPAGMGFAVKTTWEYKFVDLKNDDREAFVKAITEAGKDGWEFAGSERLRKGNEQQLVLVFKKPKGGSFPFGGGGGGGPGGLGGGRFGPGGFDLSGLPGMGGMGGRWGGFGVGGDGVEAKTFKLKNAAAADVVAVVEKTFPKAKLLKVVAEPVSNTIILVADPATVKDITKLIEDLDAKGTSGSGGTRPPGGGGAGGAGGGSGSGRPAVGGSGGGSSLGPPGMGTGGSGGGSKRAGGLTVYPLKFATAKQMVEVLEKVFPGAEITADPRTNQVIIRADEKTVVEIEAIIQRLDVEGKK